MAFPSLNQFKNALKEGARSNFFDVQLYWNGTLGVTGSRSMQFLCNAASIPGMQQNTFAIKYFGRELHYASDRQFSGQLRLTVINDEQFKIRRMFESWMADMGSAESNIAVRRFLDDYSTFAIVRQQSRSGDILRQYKFIDVFPTSIDEIALSWGGGREGFEEYTVSLAYNWWEPLDGFGAPDLAVNL